MIFRVIKKAEELTRISKGQHGICMIPHETQVSHILLTHTINHYSVFQTYRDDLAQDEYTLHY